MDKGTEIQLEVEKNKADDAAVILGQGIDGSFVTADTPPQTVYVANGIIIRIV